MPITIPKEAEQFIESEVAARHGVSADDVIMQALELYQHRQRYIEDHIQQGIDDADAGRTRPYSAQMLEDIKQAALKKMALRKHIEEGIRDIEAGRGEEFTVDVAQDIVSEIEKELSVNSL